MIERDKQATMVELSNAVTALQSNKATPSTANLSANDRWANLERRLAEAMLLLVKSRLGVRS